ncbi:MAG: zinc ribbon domain-containing protein [Bacteroidetes bacterium]|nr:zinc ribbon domain-containing protein [Bacteroidota bacterium]
MKKPYKNCQSCGMPLKKDEHGGGTESDGSINQMYCSHCFRNGTFTHPEITMPEMKALVKGKLKEFGIPGFMTGLFTNNMHKLERWKN